MDIKQGAQANKNGKVVERMLEPQFEDSGFKVLSYSDASKNPDLIKTLDRYVLKNVPFTTIYGSEGKTEFVIYETKTERSIRVESKYQATAGSVDEKYPYMLLNAISQYPEKEVILIVDGGGYKPGSRQWLKTQLSSNWLNFKSSGKKIRLMYIAEFVNWFNHEF